MKYHIFDLDGTLVDSMQQWSRTMLRILDETHTSYPNDIIRTITPLGNQGAADYFINKLKIKLSEKEILDRMDRYILDEYTYRIPIKDGVKEYIKKLKSEGCFLGVMTASPHRFTDVCLKRNGIFEAFDVVWSIDDFGTMTKNMPEIYYEAAKRIGCKVQDITFYDDNIVALTASKSAGVNTIGVFDSSSEFDQKKIKTVSDKYILTFNDLL